jgi:hypothetical protein
MRFSPTNEFVCREIVLPIKKMLRPFWEELMEDEGKWLGPGALQQTRP